MVTSLYTGDIGAEIGVSRLSFKGSVVEWDVWNRD